MYWPCRFYAEASDYRGRIRKMEFTFDGFGGALNLGLKEAFRRMRNRGFWLGVGYYVLTPLGQKLEGVIEEVQ